MAKKVLFVDPNDDFDYADDLSGDVGGDLDGALGHADEDMDLGDHDFYEYEGYDDESYDEGYDDDDDDSGYEDTRRDIWSHMDWDKD